MGARRSTCPRVRDHRDIEELPLVMRGSRRLGREGCVLFNSRALEKSFLKAQLPLGQVLETTMIANVGTLSANLAVWIRR